LHSFSATTDFNKILIMRDNEKGNAKTTRDVGCGRCGGTRVQTRLGEMEAQDVDLELELRVFY
jgi:hypothetical protein